MQINFSSPIMVIETTTTNDQVINSLFYHHSMSNVHSYMQLDLKKKMNYHDTHWEISAGAECSGRVLDISQMILPYV